MSESILLRSPSASWYGLNPVVAGVAPLEDPVD